MNTFVFVLLTNLFDMKCLLVLTSFNFWVGISVYVGRILTTREQ